MTLKEKLQSVLALLKAEISGKADKTSVTSLSASVADPFLQSKNYMVGDVCMKDGVLYKCTQIHSAGAWNASHFTATTVIDTIGTHSGSGGGGGSGPQNTMTFIDQTTGQPYIAYVNNGNFVVKLYEEGE